MNFVRKNIQIIIGNKIWLVISLGGCLAAPQKSLAEVIRPPSLKTLASELVADSVNVPVAKLVPGSGKGVGKGRVNKSEDRFVGRPISKGSQLVVLAQGEMRELSVPATKNIHVSSGKFIRIEDLDSKIAILGKKPGLTKIKIGNRNFDIQVLTQSVNQSYLVIDSLLKKFMGLTYAIVDNTIQVQGELYRFSDWKELSHRKLDYSFMAHMDSDVKAVARNYLRKEMQKTHIPSTPVSFENLPYIALSAGLKDYELALKKILTPLGLEIQYDPSLMTVKPLVRVQVIIAEVSKKWSRQVGLHWPGEATAQLLSKTIDTSLAVTLKAMEDQGMGQILASPSLVAKSGGEADFLAGGEFPIRTRGTRSKNVIWKKHGVHMKIKPKADFSGHISLELEAEVSLIDASLTIEGIPGIKTNRISTHFDLKSSRTIALSGLIKRGWGKSYNKVPFLADIPLFGQLFKSQNYLKNKTELIIFVTPKIMSVDVDEPISMPKEWKE